MILLHRPRSESGNPFHISGKVRFYFLMKQPDPELKREAPKDIGAFSKCLLNTVLRRRECSDRPSEGGVFPRRLPYERH